MICEKCSHVNSEDARYCSGCGAELGVTNDDSGYQIPEYAGFFVRFAAMIIDLFVILAAAAVINSIALFISSYMIYFSQLLSYLLSLGYFAWMESSEHQATLGKMAMGIMVTDISRKRVTIMAAFARNFLKVFSAVLFMAGFLMMLVTEKKQTFHDKLSGCIVLKRVF